MTTDTILQFELQHYFDFQTVANVHLYLPIITNVYLMSIIKIGFILGKCCIGTSQPITGINIAS